jgi:IclR family acetate operon transcriptional repressor
LAYNVPAVETAIRLLNSLKAAGGGGKSLAEACDELKIARSTGFNILKTLERHGLVEFDPRSKRYELGWALASLGAAVSEQKSFVVTARPFLRELGRETGLTCVLAQRDGDQLVMVHKEESSNDIRVTATVGERYPIAAGAIGKALMAQMGEDEVLDYLARKGLARHTDTSVVEDREFLDELARVRRRGFATSREEYVRGVNVVAAPVSGGGAAPPLAIAALGLAASLPAERFGAYAERVAEVARRVSLALGAGGLAEEGTQGA